MNPDLFQKLSGHQFDDIDLLEQALTHCSYSRSKNNERLEFLGDSILSLVISQHIYRQSPNADEGELSRIRASLVKEDTLADVARGIDLGDYLLLGGGELKSGGFRRASILSDTLEALIGAIYLDSDFEQAQEAVLYLYRDLLKVLPDIETLKDPKTRLQEYLQAEQNDLPIYQVVQTDGQAHNQTFTVKCNVDAFSIETLARGTSRKKAEQVSAEKALDLLVTQK